MKIVNTELLKSPINWAIVLLMVLIAAMAGHVMLDAANVICPHNSNGSETE